MTELKTKRCDDPDNELESIANAKRQLDKRAL